MPNLTDSTKIHEFLDTLAIPRRAGTKGETETQVILFQILKSVGFSPQSIPFHYDHSFLQILKNTYWQASLIAAYFGIFFVFWVLSPSEIKTGVSIINIIVLILIGVLGIRTLRKIKKIINMTQSELENFKTITSKNILAEKKSKKHREFEAPISLIILTAHSDSIGYRWQGKGFYGLFIAAVLSLLGCFGISLSTTIIWIILFSITTVFFPITTQIILSLIGISCSFIAFLGFICRALNKITDESHGAYDNASGMAVILDVLNRLKETKSELEWCDIKVVFFGAEEYGLWGSRAFTENIDHEFGKYRSIFVINCDTIAAPLSYSETPPKTNEKSVQLAHNFLRDLIHHYAVHSKKNLRMHRTPIFSSSDHYSFRKINHPHLEVGVFGSFAPEIHGPMDRLDHISEATWKVMQNTSDILYNVILLLDKQINEKIEAAE
jgi:hypothetical protein